MLSRKRMVAAAAVVCAVYLVWPYATLFRLAQAIRTGDAATLETLVDWDDVREGIKEDICDTVLEPPQVHVATAESRLPPFGYSFVRGIAGNAIDEQVSAEALASAARTPDPPGASPRATAGANPTIAWAFFDSPTTFSVILRVPGAAATSQPIRIQLALRGGAWKVTRAWLPPDMLVQANART